MKTNKIIKEIERLALSKRIEVLEKTICSIRTANDEFKSDIFLVARGCNPLLLIRWV